MSADQDDFLARWSRLKQEARESPQEPPAPEPKPKAAEAADGPPPELPPVESLSIESDYRAFFHPKVDEKVRHAALRKLFSDPGFNVMDGLDIYIDDYSKPDPLPAGMLAQLKQAQRILGWAEEAREERENKAREQAGVSGSAQRPAVDAVPLSAPAPPSGVDDLPAASPPPESVPRTDKTS
jgi:Protein of unknown function (DUF3306)